MVGRIKGSLVILLILQAILLAGCGSGYTGDKKDGISADGGTGVTELSESPAGMSVSYETEFTQIDLGGRDYLGAAAIHKGEIYYIGDLSGDNQSMLYRLDPITGEKTALFDISNGESAFYSSMDISNDEKVYVFRSNTVNGNIDQQNIEYTTFDMNGEFIEETEFATGGSAWGITVATEDDLFIYDFMNGNGLIEYGRDGKQKANLSGLPGEKYYNGCGHTEVPDKVLLWSMGEMYEYDYVNKTNRELFSWADLGIEGNTVSKAELYDGRVYALIENSSEGKIELAVISEESEKTAGNEEKQDKTEITIFSSSRYESSLNSAISEYNKTHRDRKVKLVFYQEGDYVYTQEDIDRMMADMLGDYPPDIVEIGGFYSKTPDIDDLINKGYVEDLSPYIESSKVISLDDYFGNVLDLSRRGDYIAAVPYNFGISTIITSASDFEENGTWTVEEFTDYVRKNPEKHLTKWGSDRDEYLMSTLYSNIDHFVDVERAICDFDCEDFRKLAEFAKEYGDGRKNDQPGSDEKNLISTLFIDRVQDLRLYGFMQFGDYTVLGYPSYDGQMRSKLVFMDGAALAIGARSEHKEEAWDFIEFYLSREPVGNFNEEPYGLPSNRIFFENRIKLLQDKDGYLSEVTGMKVNGVPYDRHPLTDEELDEFMKVVDTAREKYPWEQTIMAIISEELQPYFAGTKTLDEAISVIDSRAGIYLAENYQ